MSEHAIMLEVYETLPVETNQNSQDFRVISLALFEKLRRIKLGVMLPPLNLVAKSDKKSLWKDSVIKRKINIDCHILKGWV